MFPAYKKQTYNPETLQQLWMSVIGDTHESFCACDTPFAHILYCIFPEGHKDRDLTIKQIIERDTAQCLSGGIGGASHGLADGDERELGDTEREGPEENYIDDEELTTLLNAAEDATAR